MAAWEWKQRVRERELNGCSFDGRDWLRTYVREWKRDGWSWHVDIRTKCRYYDWVAKESYTIGLYITESWWCSRGGYDYCLWERLTWRVGSIK